MRKFAQHAVVCIFSFILFLFSYYMHANVPVHAVWRAFGDLSFFLLALTLMVGPLARLWPYAVRLIPWRRTLGIWFFFIAVMHFILVFYGWFDLNIMVVLGYKINSGIYVLSNPGLGLANLLGLTGFFLSFILASTSCDKAIEFLGAKSWKWLQSFSYVIFYLISFHSIYYLFFNDAGKKTASWFTILDIILILVVISLQILAFVKTAMSNKS